MGQLSADERWALYLDELDRDPRGRMDDPPSPVELAGLVDSLEPDQRAWVVAKLTEWVPPGIIAVLIAVAGGEVVRQMLGT